MRINTTLSNTPEPNIQAMPRRHVDQTKLQQTLETSQQRAAVDQPSAAAFNWTAGTPNTSMEAMPKRAPMLFSYDVPR